jgi:EmrB/QacA subfamily drug resistance transporter
MGSANTNTQTLPLSAREHAESFSGRRRTIALIIVALAFVMDLLDSTIVNIAIPSIQSNLGASYTTIQWLVAGYSLTFALLLITGGRMGDVFGYKKLFLIGVAGFTTASLICGLAGNSEILIGARLIQGSMAALMVPQVMSLMQVMYKPEERTSVNGLFGALGGLSASLGPIIGGILIDANIFHLDWRPIFLINVPIGIFGILAGIKFLPEGKSAHPLKLDLVGTAFIMVALTLLVFPLIQGRELNWPSWIFIMMALSLPAFAIFGWWQVRKDRIDGSPLVLPALFRRRSFAVGSLMNVVFPAVMIGFFLTFTLMLQAGLGFGVVHAALTGIPIAVGISVAIGVLAAILIPKLGRYCVSIGAIVMIVGLWVLVGTIGHYLIGMSGWAVAPGLLLTGVGMGMIMMPIFAAALNDVDQNHAGSASGTLNAVQQVGGAIGVALIGVIFFGQLSGHAVASIDGVAPQLRAELTAKNIPAPAQEAIIKQTKTCFVDRAEQKDMSALPESCQAAQDNSGSSLNIGQTIEKHAKDANASNFHNAMKAAIVFDTVLLIITFLLSFALPRHIRPEALQEAA